MSRNTKLLATFYSLVFLSGCATSTDSVIEDKTFNAYGSVWNYQLVERYTRERTFFSNHGFFAMAEKIENFGQLSNIGKTIYLTNSVYVVQKDGTYKHVECCKGANAVPKVFGLDEKIHITYFQILPASTDCFAYPQNQPNDAEKPFKDQVRYVHFVGTFDPSKYIFKVDNFFPGSPATKKRAFEDMVGNERSEFIFNNSIPLMC